MKLISFRGENIRGYQNHCINFRNGVTFLIGINGSGKTTVLNLIQGLLTPSLKILSTIEYSYIEIELVVNQDMKKIVVSSTKSEDLIAISIAMGGQPPIIAEISRNKLNSLIEIEQDNITSAELPFVDDPFIQFESYKEIRKLIKTPLFISLDRVSTEQLNNIERRNIFAHRRNRNVVLNINDCLEAIQNNIYSLYRKNSTLQNQYIVEFRNQVVRTSLKFNNDDFSLLSQSRNLLEEKGKIEKKETDFLEAIKGLEMEDIIEEAQSFFKKLKRALNIMLSSQDAVDDKKRYEATITWILNNTQLLKVDEIIESGHSYQQKMERLKAPISRFIRSVNLFFHESNKQLVISKTGDIKIIYSNTDRNPSSRRVNNIKELSSGEKQIIAMFGSLIFHNNSDTSDIYFVDEPEISLHLSWQDLYVDALLTACPNNQFILATHSPNIISKSDRREWCVDLSPKMLNDEN